MKSNLRSMCVHRHHNRIIFVCNRHNSQWVSIYFNWTKSRSVKMQSIQFTCKSHKTINFPPHCPVRPLLRQTHPASSSSSCSGMFITQLRCRKEENLFAQNAIWYLISLSVCALCVLECEHTSIKWISSKKNWRRASYWCKCNNRTNRPYDGNRFPSV